MDEKHNKQKDKGLLPSIRPSSDLRLKFTEVMNEIYQSDEPVFLTRRGRCDTVIMSADTFSKYELTQEALYAKREEISVQLRTPKKASYINCSFCGRKHEHTKKIIAGPGEVYICDDCIALCWDILLTEDIVTENTYTKDRKLDEQDE